MAKFNHTAARPVGRGPITSEATPAGHTFEGAPGYVREARSELWLLAVSNMVSEHTFYEAAADRDSRFTSLVHQTAVQDPQWFTGFVRWLRNDVHMRSAALVAGLEGARARVEAGEHGHSRQMVDAALARADEPGEALAYWTSRYGRTVPKPVKRGIADAVQRLYTERSMLKYDTPAHAFRFSDVLNLVHPAPAANKPWQGPLFAHAHERRQRRKDTPDPALLPVLARNTAFGEMVQADPGLLLDPDELRRAGLTWEAALSLAGDRVDKARLWEAMIPSMGYMALLRNLRGFDQAGVGDAVAAKVAARLADPDEVARSRQLPMRFLAAYRSVTSLRWGQALETALTHSLAQVPALPGRTLVLVDESGSMGMRLSERSDLTCADAAQVFGAALALRAQHADLVQFDGYNEVVPVGRGDALLRVTERFWGPRGGTRTAEAVRAHFRGHDRVVIVTDEQAHGGYGGGDPTEAVPGQVPVYTWNLAGYRHGHAPSGGGNRHTFGGLSDAAFTMVPLIEAGLDAGWPWEG